MGLITGKYLEDPNHRELVLWEPGGLPPVVDWPKDVPYTWTTEEAQLLLLTLLRMLDKGGVPFAVPCVELGDRHCPLTHEAVSDLSKEAQDKIMYFPSQLIVLRLVKDEDEEVLPESLARKLLTFAGIARPEEPFTLSFTSTAGILMEFLPGKG